MKKKQTHTTELPLENYQFWCKLEQGGVEGLDVDDRLDDDAVQEHLGLVRHLQQQFETLTRFATLPSEF